MDDMNDATEGSEAARIWRLTFQFSAEVLTEASPAIEMLGLDPKEFFVLDGIAEQPFPAELARYLSMPKPSVTAYLKSLQAKGFIAREIDASDLRRHRLLLTLTGHDVLNAARHALAARYEVRLGRLDSRERGDFEKLLGKLTA